MNNFTFHKGPDSVSHTYYSKIKVNCADEIVIRKWYIHLALNKIH